MTIKNASVPEQLPKEKKEQIITEAKALVNQIFAAGSEPVPVESVEIMKDICELIANGYLRKVSIVLPGGIKANIKTAAKAKIEVEKINTTKIKSETETEL